MNRSRSHLPMMAGWLFADLFLLLLITGLAATPPRASADPTPSGPATSAPTRTPGKPRPSPPKGLDPKFVNFTIPISPDAYRAGGADNLVKLVESRLTARNPKRRMVGLVLVFASDDRDHIGRAGDTATDVVDLLKARSRPFSSSIGFGYWNGANNNFQLKVFFLN